MPQNWTILAVDDEPDNLSVIVKYLELHNITVYTAPNGKQAIELVEAIRPHVILMDMAMPGISGWDALTKIRINPEYGNVPIIALTAHVMYAPRADVLSYGFDGYIAKPFDLPEVLKEVKYWLERSTGV